MKKIKEIKEFILSGVMGAVMGVVIVLFLVTAIIFKVFNIEILPSQFYGALIGVFITGIVTALLLRGQTEGDEKREKSIKVFEKKQEVYYNFLERLKEILQDGEIHHIATKNADGSINSSVDDLKDLIFQFAYLQLHTSEKTINGVVAKVAKLIQLLNDFNSTKEAEKQDKLPEFYASFSDEIFGIITFLKEDLYNDNKNKSISKEKMSEILRECNLFIETKDFDKYELQYYFFDELCEQLKNKGYDIKNDVAKQDVIKYYAKARNRHRYYGISFPIHVNKLTVNFRIELENNYYYGFYKPEFKKEYPELVKTIKQVSSSFKETGWWYGYKFSDNFDLDFWNLNSKEFKRLKDSGKRKQLISDIANEIDGYIKVFIKIAQQNIF